MLEQYLPTEICTRKYIHDITKWFCCGKKRTLGYYLMTSDHRILVSKVLWEQRKVLGFKVKVNARWQIANKQSAKMGNTFPTKFKEKGYYDL